MKKLFCILILFNFLMSQEGGLPGGLFRTGVGARSLGMGKAFSAVVGGAESIYYNPANTAQIRHHNVSIMHSGLYAGTFLEVFGYAFPTLKYGEFGLQLLLHHTSGIEARDELGNPIGSFGYFEGAILVNYARSVLPYMDVGFNIKTIQKKVQSWTGIGVGLDMGVLLFPNTAINIGIVGQNIIAPKLTLLDEREEYPPTLRLGLALHLIKNKVILSGDILKADKHSLQYFGGLELKPMEILSLRTGIDQRELSFGFGIEKRIRDISYIIDYAYLLHHLSDYSLEGRHKLSLTINVGGFMGFLKSTSHKLRIYPSSNEGVLWIDVVLKPKNPLKRWQLFIKDTNGEVVRVISSKEPPPQRLSWDGRDDLGRLVADGKYYYEFRAFEETGYVIEDEGFLIEIQTIGPAGDIKTKNK